MSGQYVVTDLRANDGFWHFICVTWQSHDGLWQVYLNGSLFSRGTGLSNNTFIPGGGLLVMFAEIYKLLILSFISKTLHDSFFFFVLRLSAKNRIHTGADTTRPSLSPVE